ARSESKIAQTNLALRQLKYGVLIYKRIAPGLRLTASNVPLILITSGQTQKSAKPHWIKGTRIQFVLSDDCFQRFSKEIAAEIEEQRAKPPLSKFQLDATVDVVPRSRLLEDDSIPKLKKLHVYPRGEFWRSASVAKQAELSTIEPLGKLPTLVSDILV